MPDKDYYRILHVPPTASTEEVKKAFRKLAQIHHPDKNKGAASSSERFEDIYEAYQVLKDRKKRTAYHYQTYQQRSGDSLKPLPETPEDVFQLASDLSNKIAHADPFRIDTDLVYFEIKELLSDNNLQILRNKRNETLIHQFITQVLQCMHPVNFEYLKELCARLQILSANHPEAKKEISDFTRNARREYIWNRYKVYIALVITVIICLYIFLIGKK